MTQAFTVPKEEGQETSCNEKVVLPDESLGMTDFDLGCSISDRPSDDCMRMFKNLSSTSISTPIRTEPHFCGDYFRIGGD
jgi:hypothetical protein